MSNLSKGFRFANLFCIAAILCGGFTAFGQEPVPTTALREHRSGVTSVRFSDDGRWLASSSLDGTVRLWSTRTWKATRVFNHGAEIYATAFSPDGRLLVSGGYDRRLVFWELSTGKLRRVVKLPDWVAGIAFRPTGQLVAGCSDGIVR